MAATLWGCSGGAGLGRPCSSHDECTSGLQCIERLCVPLCSNHLDCGDGYACSTEGLCNLVSSNPGDACSREADCGAGQACRLDAFDLDNDGQLAATCQLDMPGAATGAVCSLDSDCRNGNCSLGRCLDLCAVNADCATTQLCATIPRLLASSNPVFNGCFQANGTLTLNLPVTSERQSIRVPVPSNAAAFSVTAAVDDPSQLVGFDRIVDPSGMQLFVTPQDLDDYFTQAIRHKPERLISVVNIPHTPDLVVAPGTYRFDVSSFDQLMQTGTAVPTMTAVYKFGAATALDLHFHFLDLAQHPCRESFSSSNLNAGIAASLAAFQSDYLAPLAQIFSQAGIALGNVTYDDISDRADLDSLHRDQAASLFELGNYETGVNIFFVRSIEPSGVQAIAGGNPGPSRLTRTAASGVAVSLDTICYRDWSVLARATAHVIGQQLGLARNVEPDGHVDLITDSDAETTNLMHFSEFGGVELSDGQGFILRQNAGLR